MKLKIGKLNYLYLIICLLLPSVGLSQVHEKECWVCKGGVHESEHPYKKLSWKNEKPFIIAGLGTMVAAFLTTSNNNTIPTTEEISALDRNTISGIDRRATYYSSTSTASLSDYFRTGATFIPIFFLANHHTRDDVGALLVLTSEVMSTTAGLTFMTKNLFPRYRPFMYNEEFTLEDKQSKTGTKSFFSGHTSHTAAFTFLIAKVFHDYHPNSKKGLKIAIWTFSAALPALTGYFRVRAGKHFPTDVITGYAIGALTGIVIPQLHKKGVMETDDYKVMLGPTPYGYGIRVAF